ncbi:MAG: hypothetical protein ACYDGR_08665 [Candidatus Dormibacteria bacterium]
MDRESARRQWDTWAEGALGSDPARRRAGVEAALAVLEAGGSSSEAAIAARAAAERDVVFPPEEDAGRSKGRPGWADRVIRARIPLPAAAAVVVLALGGVALRLHSQEARQPAASASASPAAVSGASASAIRAFLPEAEHRKLKFKHPVDVRFMTEAEFTAMTASRNTSNNDAAEVATRELRAMGLVDAGFDLAKSTDMLVTSGVVGLYDLHTRELLVRGVDATPSVRKTLVHELTHALQDQNFQLDNGEHSYGDEQADAFRALVEGDAVRVEQEYVATFSPADRAAYEKEQVGDPGAQRISAQVPQALIELFIFPYVAGPPFTEALIAARGQAGLNQAFVNRPTTTSQVIHPEKYLLGDGLHEVTQPLPDGKPFDHGMLGELGLRLILEKGVEARVINLADLQLASSGWGGDRYVAWDAPGGKACIRDEMQMDSPPETAAVYIVLKRLAGTRSGLAVSRRSAQKVDFTACG